MRTLTNAALLAGSLMIGLSTSSFAEETKEGGVVETAETAVFDILDKESLTIAFDADSSVVSDSEKATLRALINAFRNDSKIKRVVVAAWSDNDLPQSDKEKLSSASKKLATDRANNIKKFLTELKVIGVETHSMAQQANWVQELFRTEDAKIKGAMKSKTTTDDTSLSDKLTSKGGAGKAVVIIFSDKSKFSH